MKKRLLAMLLVLALAVSVMTVGVGAVSATLKLERGESDTGDNWFWNGRSCTLVLKGGVIDAHNGINIDCNATIVVNKDTTITGPVTVEGDLTVEGGYLLSIYETDVALTVEDDLYLDQACIEVLGAQIGISCGGEFTAEYAELYGNSDVFVVCEEDIEINDSTLLLDCLHTALFADGNVEVSWSEFLGLCEGPVVYAGEDVLLDACELDLESNRTSAVWAEDRIRIRDCDLEYEVYDDDYDDADHPLFASAHDLNALYYEDDEELAYWVCGETAFSAYEPVLRFALTVDEEEPVDFKDVASGDWFAEAVDYVSSKGLMIGTGKNTFSPNETLSNAMAWMILARINDAYTMSEGNWYDAAQSFVVTNGLSDGMSPDGAITREAFIAMLFKSNGSYCVRDLSMFSDAASISESAVEAMRWAVEEGIIKGENGKLNPKGHMTRAELAEILMRLG